MPGERRINPQNPARTIHGRKPRKSPLQGTRAERYQAKLAGKSTPAGDATLPVAP